MAEASKYPAPGKFKRGLEFVPSIRGMDVKCAVRQSCQQPVDSPSTRKCAAVDEVPTGRGWEDKLWDERVMGALLQTVPPCRAHRRARWSCKFSFLLCTNFGTPSHPHPMLIPQSCIPMVNGFHGFPFPSHVDVSIYHSHPKVDFATSPSRRASNAFGNFPSHSHSTVYPNRLNIDPFPS